MRKTSQHVSPVSRIPVVATTGAQLKFDYLGDFIVYMERLRRSAPWGIAWPKDFIGEEGGS